VNQDSGGDLDLLADAAGSRINASIVYLGA
jgi:hypothetical protein